MTTLIELRDAHKRYGDQLLLDGATVSISDKHKMGFVGRNGAGKSTLCRVLLHQEPLDAGQVTFHPRLRLGYLRQDDPFQPEETVLQFLMRDSGKADWQCGEVAARFSLKSERLEQRIDELSGGWQTRVKLAGLLLHEPNLLLLDEPTNFLDLRTQVLLEQFLRDFAGACVIVSHDRGFLKTTCRQTLELARGKLTLFTGDIDKFLENQRERREHDERVNATVIAKRRQLETFINKNRANANTAAQARNKAKQLERLKLVDLEGSEATLRIRAPVVERRNGTALRCEGLAIGYDQFQVADRIDLEVPYGSRTAVVGDNGQGKTTLLRTLAGSLPQLGGQLRWGYHCQMGCYAQHVYTALDDRTTVREYLEQAAAAGTSTQYILDLAGCFLFRESALDKRIRVLSGGERARLCLAGLLLDQHSVLVLDEPGNHLDVESVEALAQALCEYQGTVLFTSHDRHFMHRVATDVVEVRDGRVVVYTGSYDDYLYRIQKETEEGNRALGGGRAEGSPASKPPSKAARQQDRSARKKIQNLERKIERLDGQKREINAKLMQSSDVQEAQQLHDEMLEIGQELAELEEQWLELQEEGEANY